MPTTIPSVHSPSRQRAAGRPSADAPCKPCYDCHDLPGALKVVVYIPGVEAKGVEIEGRGPDLIITALKPRFVRVNWQALHLEGSQRDYRLRLRLGLNFDFSVMQADIREGVLTVTLPKRDSQRAAAARLLRVA
jgi:HSP20 family molecular chaperone IbpA